MGRSKAAANPKVVPRVSLSVAVDRDLFARLDRLREETGVPIRRFVVRAIVRALDAREPGAKSDDALA